MYLCFVFLLLLFMQNTAMGALNVVLIFIDDLRPLSEENIHLPNIEEMAARGVNFKNAFAQQALCAPSRNSILTGRRPDTLRLYDFYSYWRNFSGNFTTLPQYFKQNGYETFSVGKVFHPGESSGSTDDYPYSWSRAPYHPPTGKYKDAAVCYDDSNKKLQKNLICPVSVAQQPGKTLPDLQSLNYALKIVNRNSSIPYFLAVGFHKPHIPMKFPRKYLKRVPMAKVKPPRYPKRPDSMPLVAWHPWTDVRKRDDIHALNISFPMGTMPTTWTLRIRQSYYAAAKYIDDLIGILLNHIDRSETVVVLTSDHGWSLGENGLWAKYSNFDAALRVPLIFNVPNMPKKTINNPVELIDIFPTVVDLAGITKPPTCKKFTDLAVLCNEGKTLTPLMAANSLYNINHLFALSQCPRPGPTPESNTDKPRLKDIKVMGYSIRTNRYRYTEWISFNSTCFTHDWDTNYGIELYDHLTDPEESNNVNSNILYKYKKIYLSKLLRSQIDPN